MSNCIDCYGVTTVAPCSTVGCISTNYGKCITYSGDNLFCTLGAVGTVTVSGTAAAPVATTTVTISSYTTSGTGTGATFQVTRTAASLAYTVTVVNKGSGFAVGDTVTILGANLGGTTPANNLVITIATLNPVISTGSNLDSIIEIFHNALCSGLSTSGGLDYSGLTYGCLRQNGSLTGLGTPITTEEQFVESASAALCSLNTNLVSYDTLLNISTFEAQTHIPGLAASAPYTLNEALNLISAQIGTLNTSVNMSSVSATCTGYSFTSEPSGGTVYEYINWLAQNICGVYTTVSSSVSSSESDVSDIISYIAGVSTFPSSVNTSSITGGTSGSTLHTAVNTIISNIATLNSTVSSIPASTYAVTWNTCFAGTYPSNSVFKNQTWNYSNSAASIQTQFDRIASILSRLNIKFDSTYFTVDSASSCGALISLTPAAAFSASSLNTISINSMLDVNTSSATDGDFMVYDTGSNEWVPKSLSVTINGSSADVSIVDNAGSVEVDLTIATSTPLEIPFIGFSNSEYTVVSCPRFATGSQPFPYATKVGDIATINGVFQVSAVGAFSWAHLANKTIGTVPVDLQPTNPAHFNTAFYVKASGVYSIAHGTVSISGSNIIANLMSPAGSITLTSGDIIEISIAGFSYNV
jgi:hypothetical protein